METEINLNLKSYSNELKLLLSLIGLENDPELPPRIINNHPTMNWNHFLELTEHHRVYPLVYVHAKRLYRHAVPEHVLQKLYSGYCRNTFQMLHLTSEMERVLQAFEKKAIRSLMLKGPVLAKELYGEVSLRTCKDLDILVPLHDVERAEIVLQSLGYELYEGDAPKMLTRRKGPDSEHHRSFVHAQSKVEIELHWRINREKGKEPSFDELWERRTVSSLTNYPVYLPGNEDLFFSLATHGVRHGWFRLRWLADIHYLVKKPLRWSLIVELFNKYGFHHYGAQTLILTGQLLRTQMIHHDSFTVSRQSVRLAKLAAEVINGRSNNPYKLYLISQPSQKIKYIINMLYPKPCDFKTLPLPEQLHVLYFPLRPFLWIWRKRIRRNSYLS